MTKQVLEVVEFKLIDGAKDDEFLDAIESTKLFTTSLDGFISRITAKNSDGLWIDVVKWRDMKAAEAAIEQFDSAEAPEAIKDFMMMIDHASIKMHHFEIEATM